jgi:drug/metabolite transporter (DMT)-like permease
MLFAAGLFEYTKGSIIGQLGSAAFLGYAISTCAIGVIIIDMGRLHDQLATALFLFIPVSAALTSFNLFEKGIKNYAFLGVVATIFGIVPWLIGGPVDALKELTAILPFSIWQVVFGLHMYGLEGPNEWH